MGDEADTHDTQNSPAEGESFWTDLLGAAAAAGIALWGVNKVSKLFEAPPSADQAGALDLAWKQYAAGETQQARENLFKWVNTNLEKHAELNQIAWYLATRRIDPESAVVIAEHFALKLAPQNATYLDTLAEAYLVAGRQEEARWACDEAWKYAPDPQTQFSLLLRMGIIYELQPLIHLAIQQYQKAEALNISAPPYDMADVYLGLGRCHAANGDWPRSIRALEQSLELRPGNAVIRTYLANGLIGVSPPRLKEAQNHLRYAVDTMPAWGLPYYLLACAGVKAGDCAGAAQWLEKGIRHFPPELIQAAKTEPLLEPCRRQVLEVLVGSGHISKQEYDQAVSPTLNLPSLSVEAAGRPKLRGQLETAKPRALPYFISFYTDEAAALARELRGRLGDEGFLSANDLRSGSQWKKELERNLKRSQTFLMLETPQYHTRPACKTERAFAVAAGMRVIRIGLCPYGKLPEYPGYVDELQYEDFTAQQDMNVIIERILELNLPGPVDDLKTRKEAGRELVRALTPEQLQEMADLLGFGEELRGENWPGKISAFLPRAFRSEANANRLCKEIALASLF